MSGDWAVAGYRHVRELGRGPGGRVVLAVAGRTGEPVAIRYLPAGGRNADAEAKLITSLDDPALVRQHEYVTAPQGAALIGDLVNGLSLERLLMAEGRLAPEAALAVFKTILLGLKAMHGAGVLHGAISPGAVLVTEDGTSRLGGLGVAAFAEETPVRQRAPELWQGRRRTVATDLYAATAVLHECLTGEPPFPAGTADEHCLAPIPLEGVPAELVSLITAGLAKHPDDRPPTASIFLGRLESAALAAYGAAWESRGRALLGERAAVLALLFPLASRLPEERAARFCGRRARRGALTALAAAAALLACTAAAVYAGGSSGGAEQAALPGGPGKALAEGSPPAAAPPSAQPSLNTASPSPTASATATPRVTRSGTPDPSASPDTGGRPDRPGGPSASPSAPAPFRVTGVQVVALDLDPATGTATAQVKVTGSGRGTATIAVQFHADGVPHGDRVTVSVEVNGSAVVSVSRVFEVCPSSYSAQAFASPGDPSPHTLTATADCAAREEG
ncbi:serine/threonine-protein kinase [Thermomonospora catenispora]|uniref:serine/threonine-protein kinase n=1 Tax=Thermomonospora catenispora TaxID=2493090 RepID=UPI001120ACEC|nr:serine/threonine-protein kinase [Thermomonospora catenispora]TNY38115.1 serine/threonine protein kinase [Thermomonospora catenispora]